MIEDPARTKLFCMCPAIYGSNSCIHTATIINCKQLRLHYMSILSRNNAVAISSSNLKEFEAEEVTQDGNHEYVFWLVSKRELIGKLVWTRCTISRYGLLFNI